MHDNVPAYLDAGAVSLLAQALIGLVGVVLVLLVLYRLARRLKRRP